MAAIKIISSRENALYKELKHLAGSSQARRKAGRTLLDGVHLCETYLHHVGVPPLCIVRESASDHVEVAPLLARCLDSRAQCLQLPDALFNALSPLENGVGILFFIDTPVDAVPAALERPAILLDRLQDPGNLGSILRSAAAAGIKEVFCSPGTNFAWSPKVLRAGMGAHFLMAIHENVDLAPLVRQARIPVLATSSHASEEIYQADLKRDVAWLFGNEGQGVSENLLELATQRVAIPHLGEMESLNVAACAAVCFFEQVRQRRG